MRAFPVDISVHFERLNSSAGRSIRIGGHERPAPELRPGLAVGLSQALE